MAYACSYSLVGHFKYGGFFCCTASCEVVLGRETSSHSTLLSLTNKSVLYLRTVQTDSVAVPVLTVLSSRVRQERWTGDAAGSSAQRAGRLLWDIRAENQQRSEEFLLGRFQPPGLPQLFLLAVVPIIRAVGASLNLELKL